MWKTTRHRARARGWLALWLVSALLVPMAATAATKLGDSCDLSVLGAHDSGAFLHFDNSLREALAAGDAGAVAALVSYPLRVNLAGGGRAEVRDAAAFRQHASALMPALRKAVDAQQPGGLFCNADGVMYDNGVVWVNAVGSGVAAPYRITALEVASLGAAAAPAAGPKALLACATGKFRIEIEDVGGGTPRYRSWNLPHGPPEPPAMQLTGTTGHEGTGACARRVWRFHNGNVEYVVSEPGCTDGSEPAGTKARLEVNIAGKPQVRAWCS